MRDVMDITVVDVQSVTVRAVAGHGDQAELTIQTRRGSLTVRLIPRGDGVRPTIRVTDLRARDKRKRTRVPVAVTYADLGEPS